MPLVRREADVPGIAMEDPRDPLARLVDADPATRRQAARELSDVPAALDALMIALERETSASVAEAIFSTLMKRASPEVAARLIELMHSDHASLRNGAIEALKTMPSEVLDQIDALLSGEVDIRIFAVEILGALTVPGTLPYLLRVIESETHVNVCAAAIEAMMEFIDESAVFPLRNLLVRFPDQEFLRYSVQAALRRVSHD